eukprot:3587560-Pleurochrysis_carterae.AAC.1
MHLRTTLHAEACLERTAALTFVYPDEANEGSAGRYVRAIDIRPAAVGGVVVDLCPLCGAPSGAVVRHRLLPRAWVR